jgi:hypothetical protein
MQASIGGEIVTLHTNSSSTADLVNEQVHIARKEVMLLYNYIIFILKNAYIYRRNIDLYFCI